MNKIPTVFQRDDRFKVTDTLHPNCLWVADGEGVATEELDGTNIRVTTRAGTAVRVEKRRNPTEAQKAEGIRDGWYVDATADDKWIFEAVANTMASTAVCWPDGEHCCEALGPKIQGNPLGIPYHICVAFDLLIQYYDAPRTFEGLRAFLATLDSKYSPGRLAEGIVFHHPDGRRAKIKRKDFA